MILLACLLTAQRISAVETPASTNTIPGFSEMALTTGNWSPRTNWSDLLVFFHGRPPVVCSNLTWSGKLAPVVVVNFAGLSAAYAGPFRDTNRSGAMLREARLKLDERAGQSLGTGRLALASFSAGFGAVRETVRRG